MGDWVIISKLVIVFYCGLKYINGDMKNTYLAALFILLYIAINITFHIVKNKSVKRVVLSTAILAMNSNTFSSSIKIGVLNKDNKELFSYLVEAIEAKENFKVISIKENEINEAVSTQKIDCALVISEGFSEGIYTNSPKEINLISIKGEDVTAWIKNYTNFYINDLINISKASNGNREVFNKIYQGYKDNCISLKTEKSGC